MGQHQLPVLIPIATLPFFTLLEKSNININGMTLVINTIQLLFLAHSASAFVAFYFYKPLLRVRTIKLSVRKIFKCLHRCCTVPFHHHVAAAAELQAEPFPVFESTGSASALPVCYWPIKSPLQ